MIKLSNIRPTVLCYCSSLLRIPVRTKKKKIDQIPVVHKWLNDKELFGPLLEKKGKKRKTKKNVKNTITSVNTENKVNITNDNNKDDNNYALSELCWDGKKSKIKRIQIVKYAHANQFSTEKESISSFNMSDTPHSNDITVDKIDNQISPRETNIPILESDSVTSFISEELNDQMKTSNFTSEINDTTKIPTNLGDNSISSNFPLIDTTKEDQDQWKDTKIISTPITDQKNFFLPGVTKILNETASEETKLILEKWKQKMILQLGEIGFEKYMKDQLENSKLMHSLIADFLYKKPIDIPDHLNDTFRSMNLILQNVDNVRSLESHVIHSDLRYRGIIDCVAHYRGNLCLIDWKKSDKIKTLSTTYDLPLQLSAYVGALNSDPNYPFKVKMAVLAIAYSGGQPPSVFEFSEEKLQFYWKEWLKRLEKYYLMKSTRSL
ncbi:mitochondrial genome maintenance exonuclease 1-like [Chelonus insularis]|uniref:mitochondrial genome maintenance exonuclease 1-like n=1 Tax=Chelonus insularis TaxID=460826 RepID=UPI00158F13A0|nr:mitochondrial genome maintenance exonuclease 1-like [Chelonus insularis]